MLEIYDLKCEYKINPMGIDVKKPRFSWKLKSDKYNVFQKSYTIEVSKEDKTYSNTIWSKTLLSDETVHIEYEGPELESTKRYYYRVKIVDNYGEEAVSSGKEYFEMGLIHPSEWIGEWIGKNKTTPREEVDPCPIVRKEFRLAKKVKKARVYISAMGLYELHINGEVIGDYVLTPGWTSYNKRIQYQSYEVTENLKEDKNTVGIYLGDGWHNGELTWSHKMHTYGEDIGALAQILVVYEDGTKEWIVTDCSWKASTGGILYSEIYNGEVYDANLEPKDWDRTGFDDRDWESVIILDRTKENIVSTVNEGTKRIQEIIPKEIIKTPKGETLIDMGQNMSGWVRVTVSGNKGDRVSLKHAEILDGEGNFYFDNIRLAKQETTYILNGEGKEIFEPHFTFQGFRYVKILNFPGEPKIENFTGVVIHTDMEETVQFQCSDPLINQLQHNIIWGQKGNFIDVPTDCPQRDERLGWTGDAQVFARTACFNFHSGAFFTKWLEDVKADQFSNGAIPFVVPSVLPKDWRFLTECNMGYEQTSAGWGDAITIIPWTLYLCYGDKRILEENYDAMKKYVEYIRTGGENQYIWDWGPQLGDWLALDNTEGSYRGATDNTYVATAYYSYSTKILRDTAGLLQRKEDEKKYSNLYDNIIAAFKEMFLVDGEITQNTQTAPVIALAFDMLEGKEITLAIEKLVKLLEKTNNHLTTGFIGTPYLCHVLSSHGYGDVAYKLLLQKDYPSWLYQVSRGATTIWEHWDGKKPDDSFWSPNMNSFNHYAYGAVGDWLYRVAAGIEIDKEYPGYKHSIIKPLINDCINDVKCEYESIHGKIASQWSILEDGTLEMNIKIPENTISTIYIPAKEDKAVKKAEINIEDCSDINYLGYKEGCHVIKVGSGEYSFMV